MRITATLLLFAATANLLHARAPEKPDVGTTRAGAHPTALKPPVPRTSRDDGGWRVDPVQPPPTHLLRGPRTGFRHCG